MIDKFKDDKNVIFLSEDFVLYPDRTDAGDVIMVMLPQKVTVVGEAEGVKDAVLIYPATTADLMLRKHFKVPLGGGAVASAILAFDVI
jgi:hypothetical protein